LSKKIVKPFFKRLQHRPGRRTSRLLPVFVGAFRLFDGTVAVIQPHLAKMGRQSADSRKLWTKSVIIYSLPLKIQGRPARHGS
jgi:hypothetical protein